MARRLPFWDRVRWPLTGDYGKVRILEKNGALIRTTAFEDVILDVLEQYGAGRGKISNTAEAASKQAYAAAGLRIAKNTVASLPLILKRKGSDKPIESGKAYDFLRRPSPKVSMTKLLKQTVMDIYAAGRAIWWFDPADRALYVIPAKDTTVILNETTDKRSKLLKPIAKIMWGDHTFLPEEIVLITHETPLHREDGESPLAPAIDDLGADAAIALWAKNMAQSGMRPNLYAKTKQKLGTTKLKEYRNLWEEEYSGTARAGKVPMLDADWDLIPLQLNAQEMQLAESRKIHNDSILVALGIATVMVRAGEATYENLREAELIYHRYQGKPMIKEIQDALNYEVLSRIDSNCYAEFDLSDIPAVRYLQRKASEGAKESVGLTVREIRRMFFGLGDPEDEVYMPISMVPTQIEIKPTKKSEVHPAFQKIADLYKTKEPPKLNLIGGYTPEQRQMLAIHAEALLQSFERQFGSQEAKAFRQQERLVKKVVNEQLDEDDEIGKLDEVPVLIDWIKEEERFKKFAYPVMMAAMRDGANSWLKPNRDKEVEITIVHKEKIETDAKRFSKDVNKTTLDRLEKAVLDIRNKNEKGLRQLRQDADIEEPEEPEEEMSDKKKLLLAVAAIYVVAQTNRTRLGAESEMVGALNYGRLEGMDQGGVESKQWLTNVDGHECDICAGVDGEIVPLREPFSNGIVIPGYGDPHPGCRCGILDVRE